MVEYPVWVVPSIVTGCVILGSGDVRLIVCTPVPLILKSIVFGPVVTLDCVMAQRRVPVALVSAVLVTLKVESIWRPSSDSMSGRERRICERRVARSFLRLRNQGVGINGVPSNWMDRERRTGTVEPGPMRFRR